MGAWALPMPFSGTRCPAPAPQPPPTLMNSPGFCLANTCPTKAYPGVALRSLWSPLHLVSCKLVTGQDLPATVQNCTGSTDPVQGGESWCTLYTWVTWDLEVMAPLPHRWTVAQNVHCRLCVLMGIFKHRMIDVFFFLIYDISKTTIHDDCVSPLMQEMVPLALQALRQGGCRGA